ncbi:uncharacterized protein LOC143151760 [Ptiloglossa arizonensis]|uniref:uncharacterized protein LOC143151760 n=1 Tax=Ptiloglossa arizonensis TaxID=3350558 RepID=UPI003FA12DC8
MIKYVAVLFAVFCLAQSQRPPYAGNANRRYPQVLPQYLDERAATSTTTETVANRIGENESSSSMTTTTTTTTSTIPPDLPVDALGDIELINRIRTWPKEKQPFWFINWQQIQEHRGDTRHRTQPVQPELNSRSNLSKY